MKKSDLKQLIREEIQKVLNEQEEYSYPYYELRVKDYSFGSLISSIYGQMKDDGSFEDRSDQSDSGGIYLFQNPEDFDKFYQNLESNGVPEEAMDDIENN